MPTWDPERILLKRSNTPGAVPLPSDLEPGELAINTADGLVFLKSGAGTILRWKFNDTGYPKIISQKAWITFFNGIKSSDNNYETARTVGASLSISAGVGQIRQSSPTFGVYQKVVEFNTAVIPTNSRIIGAEMFIRYYNSGGNLNFNIQAREYDWGASYSTADWINIATFNNPIVATATTIGAQSLGTSPRISFRWNPNYFNLLKTGNNLRLLLVSDHTANGIPPIGGDWLAGLSNNEAWITVYSLED
jgi:hypothetical protein